MTKIEREESLAELSWFLLNYPDIKKRAERIEKDIANLRQQQITKGAKYGQILSGTN